MNTNQQTQSNSIANEGNRYVELKQGGALQRIYKNYQFYPLTESEWDLEVAKEYNEIAKEIISIIGENKVISYASSWKKKKLEKRDFWERFTPPVFIEDGKMQQLKQELKTGKWGEQLWADYMWYEEYKAKSFFWNLPTTIRHYWRELLVVRENLDIPLLDRMSACGFEITGTVGVRIFPHSKIEYRENNNATIHLYEQRRDFIVQIAYGLFSASIVIQLNHNYVKYEQMLEIIEPLFEKRGIKIKDKTDPYIYAGFPQDYIEYNEHPCAGYEFID